MGKETQEPTRHPTQVLVHAGGETPPIHSMAKATWASRDLI